MEPRDWKEMIHSEVDSGIALVTIQRAQKANALPEVAKRALADTISGLGGREDIRALVLTGQGDRAFCAGSDITEMGGFDATSMYRMLGAERAMYRAALESPKPVVAAVNGYALGAGLNLVMVCDYAVAASGARLGAPELTIGVADPLEGLLLPWIVGLGVARAMFYTGRQLDAETAQQLGLVHEVVDQSRCLERAREVAEQLASLPGGGFQIQKALLYRLVSSGDLDSVIEASRYATSMQFADSETPRALERFLNRRP